MTTITGTNQNDNIVGTDGDDIINGRNGSDVIAGFAGNDIITDGNGNDTITDGDGNDIITTGNGNSTIVVGNGNNTVTVGNGVNNITVGNGSDTITAGNGGNTITSGTGADTIHTGSGNDTISAGGGNDHVFAGGGNDVVTFNMAVNPGAHATGDGGLDTDTLTLQLTQAQFNSAAVQADLTAYNTFLAQHANPNTDNGPAFQFTAFDLSVSNFEHVNVVIVNSPVVITSGPESSTVAEQDNTTGSSAPDTTPTTPAGTLNFTDADTGDTHTVAVMLASTSSAVPAGTQADLATAVTTVLHDSTGTGNGSIDWNFAIADKDLDFLSAGQTLTVDYNVQVSDASTSSTQTVELVITGANDAVAITSGPQSASLTETPDTVGSDTPDTTPVQTLAFTDVDLADSHSVSVALDSAVWSANPDFVPGQTLNDLQNAIVTTLHDSTSTGNGGIDWNFSLSDKDLDFLGAGDTLTMTYDITVSDGTTTSTQQVTVTATGTADPSLVLPASNDVFDSSFTDAGSVVAVGNAIFDPGDQPGDASTTLAISAVNGSSANVDTFINTTYGQLFVDSSGFYEFVANSAFDQLLPTDNPTEVFNITVTNSLGQDYNTTLTLNLHGAADAAIVTSADVVGSITEDAGPTLLTNGDFETGNLNGWTTTGSDIHAEFLGLGGEFGNYSAVLAPPGGVGTETLNQSVATTAGTHYLVSFTAFGDPESGHNELIASWNGVNLVDVVDNTAGGPVTYTFDVVGDGGNDALAFTYDDNGNGIILDNVSVATETPPAVQTTDGHIAYTDVETGDTHTVSVTPDGTDYVGTFTVDPVTESSGSGSTNWHFSVNNADIQFLAQNQVLTQTYTVSITDENGATVTQDIAVALHGQNDAPTAAGETVVTDAGAFGTIDIPTWALTANDTDPDTTDQLSLSHIVSSSGGGASNNSTDAFFFDDATPGGSFDYQTTDGIATSNTATATVVNNATSATTLNAAGSGDSILIATNGTETLNGGSGNDVLISNGGSHMMSGGAANDTFAFLQTSNGPNGSTITDFNNTSEHDHIAISANNFGGGLTAGQDVSSIFETSGDNQFSGSGAEFHFDTANQTLYFSSDGSQANAIAVTSVQNGVVLTGHDILIV
jgi:VCBS repeat-containing protein